MKVSIAVPDPIFEVAERVAHRLGMSRSQLYSRAVKDFVETHRGTDVRKALEEVYGNEDSRLDPVLEHLQAEALREDW